MGYTSYVLGVKIYRDRSNRVLDLSQEMYLKKILEKFKMHNSISISTLVEKNHHVNLEDCLHTPELQQMTHIPYSNVIRCLMNVMLCTRLDISFSVRLMSHFQSNPYLYHWSIVKRVLKYRRGITHYVLCYGGLDLRLHGYTNENYAGDMDKRKSTFAYTFLLGGGAISWCSKKQSVMALLIMDAEYITVPAAT